MKCSGLFGHPDTSKLCVVSRGVDPQRHHLIVYRDYDVYALARDGIAWSVRLRADGIHEVYVTDSLVVGKAEILGYDGLQDFAINAATGELIRAISRFGHLMGMNDFYCRQSAGCGGIPKNQPFSWAKNDILGAYGVNRATGNDIADLISTHGGPLFNPPPNMP